MGRWRTEISDIKHQKNKERYLRDRDKILARAKERYAEERDVRLETARKIRNAARDARLLAKRKWSPYYKERIEKAKTFVQSFKHGKTCVDCGLLYPPYVMDFDHVKGPKMKGISDLVQQGPSLVVLSREINKCVLVCANCHRERTFSRGVGM